MPVRLTAATRQNMDHSSDVHVREWKAGMRSSYAADEHRPDKVEDKRERAADSRVETIRSPEQRRSVQRRSVAVVVRRKMTALVVGSATGNEAGVVSVVLKTSSGLQAGTRSKDNTMTTHQ